MSSSVAQVNPPDSVTLVYPLYSEYLYYYCTVIVSEAIASKCFQTNVVFRFSIDVFQFFLFSLVLVPFRGRRTKNLRECVPVQSQ